MDFSQRVTDKATPKNKKWIGIAPWSETIVSAVVAIIFLLFKKTELAQVSLVVGPALSFLRYNIIKKIEEEMEQVHSLASIVDLQRQISLPQFQELLKVYLEIPEEEFRLVKNSILSQAHEKLRKLAHEKKSEELPTSEYYRWLLPMLQNAVPGSRVWALSMMMDCEWDDTPAEEQFLKLNIEATKRKVILERIFVVRKTDFPLIALNKGVKAHLDNTSEFLIPWIVAREDLEVRDPGLLEKLGDGFIAFDMNVGLIDINSAAGIRGEVTMNPADLNRLRENFENLRINARPLDQVATSIVPLTGPAKLLAVSVTNEEPQDQVHVTRGGD